MEKITCSTIKLPHIDALRPGGTFSGVPLGLQGDVACIFIVSM